MTTWLTAVDLHDPLFSSSGSYWHDGHWAHQRVMRLFGDLGEGSVRETHSILFRVEPSVGQGRVLVQSTTPVTAAHHGRSTVIDPLLDRLQIGRTMRFCTRLNAVRSVNVYAQDNVRGGPKTTKRQIVPADELPGWAANMIHGLKVINVTRCDQMSLTMRKTPLNTVLFEGVGEITDVETLVNTVVAGTGRARAYGCGLVSLAP